MSNRANPNRDVRRIALDILCRVESGAFANRLLNANRYQTRPIDRPLLQELVLGTITWRFTLDHILSPYLRKPLEKSPPVLRNLLRLGVYQIQFLDRIPAYAAVSQTVGLAKDRLGDPMGRLVNAVLRGVQEGRKAPDTPDPQTDPVDYLAKTTSHPNWLIRRWINSLGFDGAEKLCHANNRRVRLTIRVNSLRCTFSKLKNSLGSEGIETEPVEYLDGHLTVTETGSLFQTQSYQKGWFSVQNPGAGLVVQLLGAKPEERILDICSAPGGKATAISEVLGLQGEVVAFDLRKARLRMLKENLVRLGLTEIRVAAADGFHLPIRTKFDRVLLDAPCSSLGILAIRPDVRWHRKESDILKLAESQKILLENAAKAVRKNGILVYSTCSLEPEENEHIIEGFLAQRPDFELEPASKFLHTSVGGNYLQTTPHQHGCDGAFGARLRRSDF